MNEASTSTGITSLEERDRFPMWWKNCPLFQLQTSRRSKPRPGLEDIYRIFWEPNRVSSWAYELVRRFGETESANVQAHRAAIRLMPPFPELAMHHRYFLRLAVLDHTRGPIVRNPGSNNLTALDYSTPLHWSVDLRRSNNELKTKFADWLNQEKVARKLDGKNRSQPDKLGNWATVESLQPGMPKGQTDAKKDARKQAARFVVRIVEAYALARALAEEYAVVPLIAGYPEVSGVTGRVFSEAAATDMLSKLTSG